MTWNYRQSGGWQAPTTKVRKNGQWVLIGEGFDEEQSQGEFNWINPPERSSTEYTSDYSSIQDALNSISSDTELIVDDGPYQEEFSLPSTDHITLSGGSGSPASLDNPGVSTNLISNGSASFNETSCSAIVEGDMTLSVSDASIFSPGDDVRLHDTSDLYKGMDSNDLRNTHTQYKGEFRVVNSVDTSNDTVTLTNGTHQHYDNPNGDLVLGVVDWYAEDFHLYNISSDGGVSSPSDGASNDLRSFQVGGMKNVWVTDSEFMNWNKDGVSCGHILNFYVGNVTVNNTDRYGISMSDGMTHARVQNCQGDAGRYLIQCGGGATNRSSVPKPTYDLMARNNSGNGADYLYDAHFGAENVIFGDGSDTTDTRGIKIRGFDQHLIGGSYDTGGSHLVQSTQIVRNSSIEGVYCENGSRGWLIWPKEGKEFQNLLVKDCQFENMSATPFRFREDENNDPANISNLQIVNSSWNGEWIDDQMVENSDGTFSSETISYSTKFPSNQTSAGYFN